MKAVRIKGDLCDSGE